MSSYKTRIWESRVKIFERDVMIPFCEKRGIEPTFENFVNFKEDEADFLPDSINLFFGRQVPEIIFLNSKSFFRLLDSLKNDRDIVQDILGTAVIPQVRTMTMVKKELKELVSDFLKEDFENVL